MQSSEPGLRERKRAETRDRLQTAAVTLVQRDGLEHATLDAICEAADVSTRTFFNYFDSKEDAILGLVDTDLSEQAVEQELAAFKDADAIELTVRLLFRVMNPSIASSKLLKARMTIVREHPQLLSRMATRFTRMTEQLTAAMRPILANAPGFRDDNETDAVLSAEIMLSLCSGAARAAVKEWATTGNHSPIEAVEQRAIWLVRNTIERVK
jgi:AcrR family transcriptional regulator